MRATPLLRWVRRFASSAAAWIPLSRRQVDRPTVEGFNGRARRECLRWTQQPAQAKEAPTSTAAGRLNNHEFAQWPWTRDIEWAALPTRLLLFSWEWVVQHTRPYTRFIQMKTHSFAHSILSSTRLWSSSLVFRSVSTQAANLEDDVRHVE